MRPSLFILRTTLVLSFALLLIPATSNAQFSSQPCTAGNGLYSCDFKDETGKVFFSGSINLAVGETTDTSSLDSTDPDSPFSHVELACACGVKGSVDDNKPLKKTSQVLCKDLGCGLVLAGVITGNPADPTKQFFAGNFNLSKGYVFDCIRVE